MALIPAIIHGIQAYRHAKERMAKQAEGDAGGGKLDFGPGLSMDEAGAIYDSFGDLSKRYLETIPTSVPRVPRYRADFPTFKPPKPNE